MKIAVDMLSIREDGSAGGATGFAIELVKGFAKTPDIQVVALCGDWNRKLLKSLLPNNVQLLQVIGEKKYTGIGKIDRVIRRIVQFRTHTMVLKENGVDILYCPFSAPTFKENGIPTVSTILDIQHEFYPQFFSPQELQHRRKFYYDIVQKVERVVCISDYTRETFCEKYGYPLERAQTIYIAIQNRFDKEDADVLEKLGIQNQLYIVYPANFWEHKNHKLLLNAFAMYAEGNSELKLVLTGNPLDQAEYYNELLKAMKIEQRTVITGYLTNEELFSILKHAKGLIYPSLFEGFGIPVVEAMGLNKLIASSNLTSLPEIGCPSIFYFNPKKPDEILRGIEYLANNEMTEQIKKEYRKKLEEYQADKMVQAYIDAFKEVICNKTEVIFTEEISGIYEDGWTGREVIIKLKNRKGMKLYMKLSLPPFVKLKERIVIEKNGEKRTEVLNSGENVVLEETIENNQETITIAFSKTWTPNKVLKSADERQLGGMVEEVRVYSKDVSIDLKNR